MTLGAVVNPYQPLVGLTGLGLTGGLLYIGQDGQDPETDPQTVYWDADGSIVAAQPIDVVGGYPMRLGTPARLYTAATYSIRLRDRSGAQVFYEPHGVPVSPITEAVFATLALASSAFIPPSARAYGVRLLGYYAAGDGGGADYRYSTVQAAGPGRFQSADGSWWDIVGDRVTVRQLGFKADGSDERERMRAACNRFSTTLYTLVVDAPIHISISSDPAQPIELFSNTSVTFESDGAITVNNDRLPVFWAVQKDAITFDGSVFHYAGTHSTVSDGTVSAAFYNSRLKSSYPTLLDVPPANYMTLFYMRGVSNLALREPQFIADSSAPESLFATCLYVGSAGATANVLSTNVVIASPYFDGAYMPLLTSGCDGLFISDVRSRRYGVLPSNGASPSGGDTGWYPPPHIWYNSGELSYNVDVDGVFDEGVDCGGGDWGQLAIKARFLRNFSLKNIVSFRNHGAFDFSGQFGVVDGIYWRGDATHTVGNPNATGILRLLGDALLIDSVQIRNVELYDTYAGRQTQRLIGLPDTADSALVNTVVDISLNIEQWPFDSASTPYFPLWMNRTTFNVDMTLRTPYSGAFQTFLFRNDYVGGADCVFSGALVGFQNSTLRLGSTSGVRNIGRFSDVSGGAQIDISQKMLRKCGRALATVTNPAGATATIANMIPAGAVVTGTMATITTSLGTTGGLTGFSLGISTDAARYGTRNSTGAGGSIDNRNWAATTGFLNYPAATGVVLTAVGGTFDGTGAIDVAIDYELRTSQTGFS